MFYLQSKCTNLSEYLKQLEQIFFHFNSLYSSFESEFFPNLVEVQALVKQFLGSLYDIRYLVIPGEKEFF